MLALAVAEQEAERAALEDRAVREAKAEKAVKADRAAKAVLAEARSQVLALALVAAMEVLVVEKSTTPR